MWMKAQRRLSLSPNHPFLAVYRLEPRAEKLFGHVTKTSCNYCCERFGLVRRRYFDHQFCCEACEEAYKEKRSQIAAEFKAGFHHSLTNSA